MIVSDALADVGNLQHTHPKACLTSGCFLIELLTDATFKSVLKRGPAQFLGGLTSRLSLLRDILPGMVAHA